MLIAKPTDLETDSYSQGQTLQDVFSYEKLYKAYLHARKGKTTTKRAYKFYLRHSKYLELLHYNIHNKIYKPYPSYNFLIWCKSGQKQRLISAPHFHDLIVQHAIYENIYYTFDRGFIYDSYGCRKGKGAHRASYRCQEFLKKSQKDSYYLQLDISKYYYSINHSILEQSIARKIKNKELLKIIMMFVNHDKGVGLNVGSLLSQLFGLIYLDRLDHFIKRGLKVKRYIRYVDDMVIIGESKEHCLFLKKEIEHYIQTNLNLKFSKWQIRPIKQGINFVGFRTWRNKKLLRKKTIKTFLRALKQKDERALISLVGLAKDTQTLKFFNQKLKDANLCHIISTKN